MIASAIASRWSLAISAAWTASRALKDVTTHSVENAIVSSAASSDTSRVRQRASSYCTIVGTIHASVDGSSRPTLRPRALSLNHSSHADVSTTRINIDHCGRGNSRCWRRALCRRALHDRHGYHQHAVTFVDERDLLAGPPSQAFPNRLGD